MKHQLVIYFVLTGLCFGYDYMQKHSRRKRDGCLPDSTGTTPHIEIIFLGRCWELLTSTAIPNACPVRPGNCSTFWELFQDPVIYQDPCDVFIDAYEPFVKAVPHQVPRNKTVFWSGTNYIVHQYTKATNDLLTMEDTLLGYMANGLQWCGTTDRYESEDGFDYESCPSFTQEGCNVASTAFYTATSTAIGRQAEGEVTVMLDGSRSDGAFRNDSFFAKYEFPNMDPEKVTKANIILVRRLGKLLVETCTTGSVAVLKGLFEKKKIEWACTENDERVYHIQCTQDPTNPECTASGDTGSGSQARASVTLTTLCFAALITWSKR